MIKAEYMKQIAENEGFLLSEKQLVQLDNYAELLVEWNEKINLTAITQPDEVAVKHFLDSFLLLKTITPPNHAKIIDVGTGAGFPSVPCALLRTDFKLTLLDSLNKRILFLMELTKALGVDAECLHGRAEETGHEVQYREVYDLATARAVARLRELAEYCLPFVKVGGCFAALKGTDNTEEIEESKPAMKLLGGEIEEIREFTLPDNSKRSIIIIRKISHTPTKYPRNSGKIKKQPLK